MTPAERYELAACVISDTLVAALKPLATEVEWMARKDYDTGELHPRTGVHVTFANGKTLSVQWFEGNYSNIGRNQTEWRTGASLTFEVAILGADGGFIRPKYAECDTVLGWVDIPTAIRVGIDEVAP